MAWKNPFMFRPYDADQGLFLPDERDGFLEPSIAGLGANSATDAAAADENASSPNGLSIALSRIELSAQPKEASSDVLRPDAADDDGVGDGGAVPPIRDEARIAVAAARPTLTAQQQNAYQILQTHARSAVATDASPSSESKPSSVIIPGVGDIPASTAGADPYWYAWRDWGNRERFQEWVHVYLGDQHRNREYAGNLIKTSSPWQLETFVLPRLTELATHDADLEDVRKEVQAYIDAGNEAFAQQERDFGRLYVKVNSTWLPALRPVQAIIDAHDGNYLDASGDVAGFGLKPGLKDLAEEGLTQLALNAVRSNDDSRNPTSPAAVEVRRSFSEDREATAERSQPDQQNRDVVTVYRVEGPGNERIQIEPDGHVTVPVVRNRKGRERNLWLNFGDLRRAREFLKQRRTAYSDDAIKEFAVPRSFLDELRATRVQEDGRSGSQDRPVIGDPTKANDQLGLSESQIRKLRNVVIQGSGKKLDE